MANDLRCMPLRSGALPVDKITGDGGLSVLKPLWSGKPETTSCLRGQIERVLDAAKVHGMRSGENPARWRGHLDQDLPKRQQLASGHHAAKRHPAGADLQLNYAWAAYVSKAPTTQAAALGSFRR